MVMYSVLEVDIGGMITVIQLLLSSLTVHV